MVSQSVRVQQWTADQRRVGDVPQFRDEAVDEEAPETASQDRRLQRAVEQDSVKVDKTTPQQRISERTGKHIGVIEVVLGFYCSPGVFFCPLSPQFGPFLPPVGLSSFCSWASFATPKSRRALPQLLFRPPSPLSPESLLALPKLFFLHPPSPKAFLTPSPLPKAFLPPFPRLVLPPIVAYTRWVSVLPPIVAHMCVDV